LKKRSKKLLDDGTGGPATRAPRRKNLFFGSFFKKEPLSFF
jgi:hypothetical protein